MNKKIYNILPEPKEVAYSEGCFDLLGSSVSVDDGLDPRVVAKAVELKTTISHKTGKAHSFYRVFRESGKEIKILKDESLPKEGYSITVNPDQVKIVGGDEAGCFYGIVTFLQMIEIEGDNLPCVTVNDAPDMQFRGFYHDATRGRVLSVEGAKKMVDRLVRYKINTLQFYVEHTFDFIEFRGGTRTEDDCFTTEDILEIDRYCYENFVDFQPSLSCFGHLFELLNKEEYKHLCELVDYKPSSNFWHERMFHHTIDVSNEESFELICSLIDQYLPLFRSKYFNVCCDETFDLGKGRNEGKDPAELYISFVSKIIKHVNDAGKTAMMWGDIVLNHPELLERIPEGTIMLNWDYSGEPNEAKIKAIADAGITQIVCPGTSAWDALIERPSIGEPNILKMTNYGYKYGAMGVLNTNWGDHGHACHPECALFGTVFGACVSWNVETTVDEQFELNLSRSLYKTNTNIVSLTRELETVQRITHLPQCLAWADSRNPDVFTAALETAEQCLSEAERISKILAETKGDEELVFCLKTSADGLAVLFSEIVEVKTNGEVSKEWREKMGKWFADYKKAWLLSSKTSELMEIYKVLNRA